MNKVSFSENTYHFGESLFDFPKANAAVNAFIQIKNFRGVDVTLLLLLLIENWLERVTNLVSRLDSLLVESRSIVGCAITGR